MVGLHVKPCVRRVARYSRPPVWIVCVSSTPLRQDQADFQILCLGRAADRLEGVWGFGLILFRILA